MLRTNVDILGTQYTLIIRTDEKAFPVLEDNCGITDYTTKMIIVRKLDDEPGAKQCLTAYENEVIRHELVHAFFYESGLDAESQNEQLVDWIAIQFLKMFKVFSPVGVMASEDLMNNTALKWFDPTAVCCELPGAKEVGIKALTMDDVKDYRRKAEGTI